MSDLKFGKGPAQFPGSLKDLTYYAAGPLPKAPASIKPPAAPGDIADASGPWGILGNNEYGDCGVAGLQHGMEADAEIVDIYETWPTNADAISYYLKYTNGVDSGVVLSQYLQYVRENEYYGHKIYGYAPVQFSDVSTIQTAIFLFGFAYTGVNVPQSAMDQFNAGEPWTVVSGSPIEGGHAIPLIGYDDSFLYCITWGKVQPISYNWWHSYADESWAVLTGSFVAHNGDGRGINLAALESDLNRLDV